MKKLMLGMAVAAGLVVMTGQGSAKALTSCEMEQAILEAKDVIEEVGGEDSTLVDAKGVSLQEHVAYLEERVQKAQEAVDSGYAKYPDELYATVTEGARALRLITGQAQETAKQSSVRQNTTAVTSGEQMAKTVAQATDAKVTVEKASGAKLAVVKIETTKETGGAELASVSVQTTVAAPEETAGLDTEMKVPATGEVETWELERLLMTIGIASAVGMLVLAGVCMLIGRR